MNKLALAKNILPETLHSQITDVFFSYSKSLKDDLTYFNPIEDKIHKDFIIDVPMDIFNDPFGTITIHIELGGRVTIFDDLEYSTMVILFGDGTYGLDQLHFALNRGLTDEDFIHFANTQSDYHNFNLSMVSNYFKEINLKKLANYL